MTVPSPLLAIIGPTASGKSQLALAVARARGAEILSVDSMQIYRGMDIGTAKPTPQQQTDIPHHLLDVVEPSELFSAARFVELADAVIAGAQARGAPLLAVGGTPLYFKALFQGLFSGPGSDEQVRQRLRESANDQLHSRLSQVDPAAAQRIGTRDRRRLVRALEVYELTGSPISSLQSQWDAPAARHAVVWVGLSWPRDVLSVRINARVHEMIRSGWLDETRRLMQSCPKLSQTAEAAAGYRHLISHLADRLTLEEAVEQTKIDTRQLARRQLKWFRRFPAVHWLDGQAPLDQNVEKVLALWPSLNL